MTTNAMARTEQLLIAQHAADWLRRLQSADANEHAAFLHWLRQSPLHVQEMLLAMSVDDALEGMDAQRRIDLNALLSDERNVVPLHATIPPTVAAEKKPRLRSRWGIGIAASLLLLVALGLLLTSRTEFETTLGEQRAISLEDGTVVHLNTLSRMRTAYTAGARDVYLLEGQAIFRVTHDASRPFRVHTDSAIVQAIGTQFDVREIEGRTQVAVIEGVVEVSVLSPKTEKPVASAPQRLRAGEVVALNSTTSDISSLPTTEVKDVTAWQQRRLVFRRDRLADIAAEFNRYGQVKLRVEGEQLRARRFSGTFDADDPALMLSFLERDSTVVVERRDREIHIHPRSEQ